MSQKKPRHQRNRTGAAAVEFAVAITVLIMVVFACIEFSRLAMLKHSVEYASYLGARKGMIIGAVQSNIVGATEDYLNDLGVSGANVQVTPGNIKDDTSLVEVRVTLPISGNSWISPVYFADSLEGVTRLYTERAAAEMKSNIESGS